MSDTITPAAGNRSSRPRQPRRYRSAWGNDIATLRRFGYPVRRITLVEELEDRVEALEAALAAGAVDPDGAR